MYWVWSRAIITFVSSQEMRRSFSFSRRVMPWSSLRSVVRHCFALAFIRRYDVLSPWDPCLIAEIPSDPRLIPYHSSNSIPTILRYSDTMLPKPWTPSTPKPSDTFSIALQTLNNLWKPQSHFCLHLSSSFHFNPLELWIHFSCLRLSFHLSVFDILNCFSTLTLSF